MSVFGSRRSSQGDSPSFPTRTAWPILLLTTLVCFALYLIRPKHVDETQRTSFELPTQFTPSETIGLHPELHFDVADSPDVQSNYDTLEKNSRLDDGSNKANSTTQLPPIESGYYGSTYGEVDEPTSATVKTKARPSPTPRSTFQNELRDAIVRGRRLDAQHRDELRLASLERESPDAHDPADDQEPQQVTRFDFGLGLLEPIHQPYVTTGRNRAFVNPEPEPDDPQRQLVGQVIPPPTEIAIRPRSQFGLPLFARPLDESREFIRPGCNDMRDNNANGLIDADDPACWADGRTRTTYSPWLSESEPVDVLDLLFRATTAPSEQE